MIWKTRPTAAGIDEVSKNTLVEHLDIKILEVGDDFLSATMPVDHRTVQPMRLLHGGASVTLAETLGSVASVFCIEDPSSFTAVGVEINATTWPPAKKEKP